MKRIHKKLGVTLFGRRSERERKSSDCCDFGVRLHYRTVFFGKVQIVEVERVFGTYPTADHAGAAFCATRPWRAFAPKIGVRHFLVFCSEENPYLNGSVLILEPQVLSYCGEGIICGCGKGHRCCPKHA